MTTPNIEELVERNDNQRCDAKALHDVFLSADNIAALQSQAERIKELIDSVNFKHSKITELENERDTLRAQLEAIAATEPVLIVEKEPDYWSGGHFHEGSKSHIKPTKVWCLPVGTQLFTHPMPAQDVTELVEALEEYGRAGVGNSTDWRVQLSALRLATAALSKYKGAK